MRDEKIKEGIVKVVGSKIFVFQDRYSGDTCLGVKTKYRYSWIIAGEGVNSPQFKELQVLGFEY